MERNEGGDGMEREKREAGRKEGWRAKQSRVGRVGEGNGSKNKGKEGEMGGGTTWVLETSNAQRPGGSHHSSFSFN